MSFACAAATAQTLFTTQTPAAVNQSDGSSANYELGTVFQSSMAGKITAIRFWKDSRESGTHTGRVWSASGLLLASVTFSGESASGWQQQSLAGSLTIAANTTYIVSVNTGGTYYVATTQGLSSRISNGTLSSVVGNNGLYGATGKFPTSSFSSTNYFRDVVFAPAVTLTSLTLSPTSVLGSNPLTGTAVLSNPAPAGGAAVALSSSSAAASVPLSVVVPAGATIASFPISTVAVGSVTAVVISGTFNTTSSATLTVNPPILSTLTVSPSTVLGGSPSVGTLTLTGPAPIGGATVALSVNNTAAKTPANLTVPAGAISTTFPITTYGVGSLTAALITGSYNGTKSATLAINPSVLSTLVLTPGSVVGGITSTGTIALSGPAPAGGAVVTLTSGDPVAAVPAAVIVAGGTTTVNFPVTTSTVGAASAANISATYLGTQTSTLTINIAVLSALSLNPATLAGGNSSTGTATLTGPAPAGGAVVTLSSDNPIVPGLEGVYFAGELPQSGAVDWASVGPEYTEMSSGTAMPVSGISGVNMAVSTSNGQSMYYMTNCNFGGDCGWYGNFAQGAGVLWVSGTYFSDTGWWGPNGPLTVQFDSPQRGLGFQMMGDELGQFTATLCAYDAADTLLGCVPFTGNGSATEYGTAAFMGLYDDAQEISKVTIDGGGHIYPHDFAISQMFVTNTRRPIVPVSVTVPAGAVAATFPVSTSAVATTTTVNITAVYAATQTAVLAIAPAVLSTVAMTPAEVLGGAASVGTVTLNGAAPAGGVVVSLSADNSVASGVQSVTTATNMPQDGSVTWTDIGPLFTTVNSGTTVPITGLSNSTVTISTANAQPGYVFTNCPDPVNCAWSGNFVPAAPLLWVGGSYPDGTNWAGNGPMTLTLNTPQRGFGFTIMADESGPFTGTICAYNAGNTLLGCVPFTGNGAALAGGTNGLAIYAGIYDDTAEISSITIDAGGTLYPHDFAIGQLFVANARRMAPPSVKVQAGAWTATFPVNTDKVSTLTTTTVTGTYQEDRAGTIRVFPESTPLSISGIVDLPGNTNSVTVTLSGAANATTSTDGSGYYIFGSLNSGIYTVTPSKPGFVFNPAGQDVTISGASVAGIDFAAPAYQISGTVSGAGATTVTISGPVTTSVATTGGGTYASAGLPNGVYTVSAVSTGYDFYPNSQTVTINGASATVNFVAWPASQTFTISGTVTSSGSGALMVLSGSSTATVTADSSGDYAFTGVTGGTYTVTPSKNAYNFTPTAQTRAIAGVDIPNVNFTAAVANVQISMSPGSALLVAGTTEPFVANVTGSPNTSVTWSATGGSIASIGLYTAPNAPGTYTVTATSMADNTKASSASVIVFAPTASTVLWGDQNVEGQPDTSALLGQAEAFQVTASATGDTQSIVIYLDPSSTASQLSAGLYSDNSGHPNLMLAQGGSTQLVPGAWNTIEVPSTGVVAGTPYWIALLRTTSGNLAYRRRSAAICASETSAETSLLSLPSTWTTGATSSSCPVSAFGDSTKVLFFDSFANTSLSPNWRVISRHGEYSQGETECNLPQQVSVDNALTITTTAQTATCGDFNPDGTVWHAPAAWPYSTGDIQWATLNFTYGTVEIRAQIPSSATSLWPATWLLGSNCQATNPYTGETGVGNCPNLGSSGYSEMDMTECFGSTWCQFNAFSPNALCQRSYSVSTTNFHTFTTVWNSTGITQYQDGTVVSTCSQNMNHPMFLIMQTQTGGGGGTPNNALLPASFVIDYVKVTQP